jgi:hypothetical protein
MLVRADSIHIPVLRLCHTKQEVLHGPQSGAMSSEETEQCTGTACP